MRFFFFFLQFMKKQCGFYFFKQNFRKKIHQNNSFGFFSTFIKNITSFISKWFMWPFILHALGASLMNFLPWPKLHHIWKKIQSKCTECMWNKWSSRNRCVTWSVHFLNTIISNWKFSENFWANSFIRGFILWSCTNKQTLGT